MLIENFDRPTWVYSVFCEHGGLVYVGVAFNVGRRLGQHRTHAEWWAHADGAIADLYATRTQALAVEAHHIQHGNLSGLNNRAGRNPEPRPPYRWIERRDWDWRDGALRCSAYAVLPDSPLPVAHDTEATA